MLLSVQQRYADFGRWKEPHHRLTTDSHLDQMNPNMPLDFFFFLMQPPRRYPFQPFRMKYTTPKSVFFFPISHALRDDLCICLKFLTNALCWWMKGDSYKGLGRF